MHSRFPLLPFRRLLDRLLILHLPQEFFLVAEVHLFVFRQLFMESPHRPGRQFELNFGAGEALAFDQLV